MRTSTKRVDGLPLDGLPDARILYVKTDVGHWELVTDGVALPLALRAIGVPAVASAPLHLPLGLPQRCDPPSMVDWLAPSPGGDPVEQRRRGGDAGLGGESIGEVVDRF